MQEAAAEARRIQNEYGLCDSCLGRLFARRMRLSSYKALGKRLRTHDTVKCYICRGLADSLDSLHPRIYEAIQGYQFDSFLIGLSVKPSIMERDDHIRSRHRLVGTEGIKVDLSGQLARALSRRTGARINHDAPEMIVTVNLKDYTITVRSRPIVLAARYTKESRSMPQKGKPCGCDAGCAKCDGTGRTESVESKITGFLRARFDSRQVKMTWIGGEDMSSLVRGDGRPFFAQVMNPRRRRTRLPKMADLGGVHIRGSRRVPSVPTSPVRFKSTVRMAVRTAETGAPLERLKELRDSRLAVYQDSGRIEKPVRLWRYRRTSPDSFVMTVELDGGVPIRRFVDGESVFPNLTDLLGTKCECLRLDFDSITTNTHGGPSCIMPARKKGKHHRRADNNAKRRKSKTAKRSKPKNR